MAKSPTKAKMRAFTEADAAALLAELGRGKYPTVVLREGVPNMDIPPFATGTVRGRGGDNELMVKPPKVDDELPFNFKDLLMRDTAPRSGATSAASASASRAVAAEVAPSKAVASAQLAPVRRTVPASTKTRKAPSSTRARGKPVRKPSATKKPSGTIQVQLSWTKLDGWTVSAKVGAKQVVKKRSASLADAWRAAESLGPDVADAVRPVLEAEREIIEVREAEARAELERIQGELEALHAAQI